MSRKATSAHHRATYVADEGPWIWDDVRQHARTAGAGVVALIVGWVMLSGEAAVRDQLLWTAVAIGGTGVFAMGLWGWLLSGMRRVRRLRREVVLLLPKTPSVPRAQGDRGQGRLVAIEGRSRYHRVGCQLVGDREALPLDAFINPGDLEACGVCQS